MSELDELRDRSLRAGVKAEADAHAELAAQSERLDFDPAQKAMGIVHRLAERGLRALLAEHHTPEADRG